MMPNPVDGAVIERELRYAMALGIVRRVHASATRARSGDRYRRYRITMSDGLVYVWTPAQVLAFGAGVRLATERREG